jgi:CRP-like cAMP-binding protein
MIRNSDIKTISLRDLSDLTENTSIHIFKPGQIIYYQGHLPYGLFFLRKGKIEIKNKYDSEIVETWAVLGFNSFLNSLGYSATAKAITECELNFLSKTAYLGFTVKNNQFISLMGQ